MTSLVTIDKDNICDYFSGSNILKRFQKHEDKSSFFSFSDALPFYIDLLCDDASIAKINPSYSEGSFSNIIYTTQMVKTTKEQNRLNFELFFTFINFNEIRKFLKLNPEVTNNLLQCYIAIISQFGNVKPKLEVVVDQENTNWETLFIYIPHKLDFQVALDCLNKIVGTWFFSCSKNVREKITLSILE